MSNSGVTCGGCRRPMPATKNVPLEVRQPCPDCGSLVCAIAVSASDGLTFHDGLGLKLRREGSPRVVQEQFVGAEQSADGSWVDKSILRDHEADKYVERVVRPDGTVTDNEERLSEHRGHGSDKPDLRAAREAAKRTRADERAARKARRDEEWAQDQLMSSSQFVDFTYPGDENPWGVIEGGLALSVVAAIEQQARAVRAALGRRIGDCLLASTLWHEALAAHGQPSIVVGGFGQHVDTVPPTAADQLSGYLTNDDGVVTHWWLMFGPGGLLFDPTAHQFDRRGGVSLSRYLVDGESLLEWRGRWAELTLRFPGS